LSAFEPEGVATPTEGTNLAVMVEVTQGEAEAALTFAVVSGSPTAERDLAAMCSELTAALARTVTPRVLSTYAALKEDVARGEAQVAWAPPLVAIELEDDGVASIDLCCTRSGQIEYHAALFTRHASPIEKLSDLAGCRAAWVDADSAAGYVLPRRRIAEAGLDPETLFAKETFLGTHARVARAVLEGEADVGATYVLLDPATKRPLSAGWLDAGAGINGAYVLATAGPIPSDAIVFARSLPSAVKAALVRQVSALPQSVLHAVGRLLHADGFANVPTSHFEALRASAAARPS
jgi:phosphonate transport system substrate-binding protein